MSGNYCEALLTLESAGEKIQDLHPEIIVAQGMLNEMLDQDDQAIFCYRKAIKIYDDMMKKESSESSALLNRSLAKILAGESESAIGELQLLQESEPDATRKHEIENFIFLLKEFIAGCDRKGAIKKLFH